MLQIRAARIDYANHLNDPAASMWDILAAGETLELAILPTRWWSTLTGEQAQLVVDAVAKRAYWPDAVRHSVQPTNTFSWVMHQADARNLDRPNIG